MLGTPVAYKDSFLFNMAEQKSGSCTWKDISDCPKKISTYGFDQSEKYVSIYIDVGGNSGEVEVSYETSLFVEDGRRCGILLKFTDGGLVSSLAIPNLCGDIVAAKSKIKRKPTRFVVKLKKATTDEWSDLTDALDVKEAARKKRVSKMSSDVSTQELLADMYSHATDEERAGLMEAAISGQKKREASQ